MRKLRKGQKAVEADYCRRCPCFSYVKDDIGFSGVAYCKKYNDEKIYMHSGDLGRFVCEDAELVK